jgi:dimethylhistidine N-methyltransferase
VRAEAPAGTFAADVVRDLQRTPKQLQSQYLYDELGSSLFEAICRLPWYRITRAESQLLSTHAKDVVARLAPGSAGHCTIIELGVGSGEKLATILDALPRRVVPELHLVDISAAALDATAARVSHLPPDQIVRHEGTYEQGLASIAPPAASLSGAPASNAGSRRLLLFLGSNIGNFAAAAADGLMRAMRRALAPGDLLLLGADLVKPEPDLIRAYDDPLGVTAAFNKNLLVRINRDLGGEFDLATFQHRAVWNAPCQRIEMHLVSRIRQQVAITSAGPEVAFAAGETIWTESSYKYTPASIERLATASGFSVSGQWTDPDAAYALSLFEVR